MIYINYLRAARYCSRMYSTRAASPTELCTDDAGGAWPPSRVRRGECVVISRTREKNAMCIHTLLGVTPRPNSHPESQTSIIRTRLREVFPRHRVDALADGAPGVLEVVDVARAAVEQQPPLLPEPNLPRGNKNRA